METGHLLALTPLAFMFIVGLTIYPKAVIHLGSVIYCFVLTWIAFTGLWEGLFFAAYLPIAFVSIIAFIYFAIEGEFV